MWRLCGLGWCVALGVLTGSAMCQEAPESIPLNLYLPTLNLLDWPSLKDQTSQNYSIVIIAIQTFVTQVSGESHNIALSDGGGCLRISLNWTGSEQSQVSQAVDGLTKHGLDILGASWPVSVNGCGVNTTIVRFSLYVTHLPWTERYLNHNSDDFQDLSLAVSDLLSSLGGSLKALEVAQDSQCVKIYIEWETLNALGVLNTVTTVASSGLELNKNNYQISLGSCAAGPGNTTIVRFSLYVVNLPWTDSYLHHSSDDYQDLRLAVSDLLSSLGGTLKALEVAEDSQGVKIYIELETLNALEVMNTVTTLTSSGLVLNKNMYQISLSSYTVGPAVTPTVVRLKLYLVNLAWTEMYADHSSANYNQARTAVLATLAIYNVSLSALELAQNYGCVEVYLEVMSSDPVGVIDYVTAVKKNGIVIQDALHVVQTQPCELSAAEKDDCPQLPKGTIGICIMGCDDSDLQSKCADGFKCCSNGCGRTCQRVGYVLKINATITINLSWMAGLEDKFSSIFSGLNSAVKAMIQRSFHVEKPGLISDVELIQVRNYTYMNRDLTYLDLVLYLGEDVPNENLQPGRSRLLTYSSSVDDQYFRVLDVLLGNMFPLCAKTDCYGLCKELRSSVQFCSCNKGYSGISCSKFDCGNGADFMCQNGGTCSKSSTGSQYECLCPAGYHGPLCEENINSCPSVLARAPGLIGLCQSTCMNDTDCPGGQMCCKVPCGGSACLKVGFSQKLNVSITLDLQFQDILKNTTSVEYTTTVKQIENLLNSKLTASHLPGFLSATILSIQSSIETKLSRRRREMGNVVLQAELYFASSVPVEQMNTVVNELQANNTNSQLNILNWTHKNGEECPWAPCAADALCVTKLGGDKQCACPRYKQGQLCDIFSCISEGSDLCLNGGTCSYLNDNMTMSCSCAKGYTGPLCETKDTCALGFCLNGGSCRNVAEQPGFVCDCPQGYSGSVCEDAADHCPKGQPLMTTSGERSCGRLQGQCPVGFYCNVDPLDRWTACCFQTDFLCQMSPCQAGSTCVGDFMSGLICSCPTGREGLFCEMESNRTSSATLCQKRQAFSSWLINVLQGFNSTIGVSLQDARVILQHLGYLYIPTDLCDDQGHFKSLTMAVSVLNPADRVMVCMDKEGFVDPNCTGAVCDVLTAGGNMEFCLNGGKCVGKIKEQLCDCSFTGYHGVQCELSVGPPDTECTLHRDVGNFAIAILNGSSGLMPFISADILKTSAQEILYLSNTQEIFVPSCDTSGQFQNSGCLYLVNDTASKTCYCASKDGSKVSTEENPIAPPLNCGRDSCPADWGEDCIQPDWWCSETLKCKPDMERCDFYSICNDTMCTLDVQVRCVEIGHSLPCDSQPCQDDPFSWCQPCRNQGTCYNIDGSNTGGNKYRCKCNMGYSGVDCEVNENICNKLPPGLCASDCVGDPAHGKLCECEPGYGGLFCDKPAHSPCEQRKALFDDFINVVKGNIRSWNYLTQSDLQATVSSILDGATEIFALNCTESGFYSKVQCTVSVDSYQESCFCVDSEGKQISRNVASYIDYDVCEAPVDPRDLTQATCQVSANLNGGTTVCLNGGTCVFDMFAGKYCLCPIGYSGQFCQINQVTTAPPESLCEFLAESWDTAHQLATQSRDWTLSPQQSQLYLNLSLIMIQPHGNDDLALKFDCRDDGTFKPAVCFYNIMSQEKGSCHCWNKKQLVIGREPVDSSDSLECLDMMDNSACPMVKCRYNCNQGYRMTSSGCQTCECLNPCQNTKCESGQRCVLQRITDCKEEPETNCLQATCLSADKPGACPGYTLALYSPFPDGLLNQLRNASSSCSVTCFDDTDCPGEQKCCGLCGNKCVYPEESSSCQEYRLLVQSELEFRNQVRDVLRTTSYLLPAEIRSFDRITDIGQIWIPECQPSNKELFQPMQCYREVDVSGYVGNTSSCFCVDYWGSRISGALANSSDSTSCNTKPLDCPSVNPAEVSNSLPTCQEDLDCAGSSKCCGSAGHKVCQAPVDVSQLTTTLDTLMETLCEKYSDMCQGGSLCVGNWSVDGAVCQCPGNRYGPFCELTAADVTQIPRTPCQKKNLTLQVFLQQLQTTNHSLPFNKLLSKAYKNGMKMEISSAVSYNCTPEGMFKPVQCVVNANDNINHIQPLSCFCVSEQGKEILGTRVSGDMRQSLFCGDNSMTCPVGDGYTEGGQLRVCELNTDCPTGYSCRRSTYGHLYCCPVQKGEASDCLTRQRKAMQSQNMRNLVLNRADCNIMFTPQCQSDGSWAREQCQNLTGMCGCVSPHGYYVNNTLIRGVPQCQTVSEAMIQLAEQSKLDISQVNHKICEDGQDFHCCSGALCSQSCWAHPGAVCRINPCGGCKAEFYNPADGTKVDCNEGLSPCQLEQTKVSKILLQQQINAMAGSGVNLEAAASSLSRKMSAPVLTRSRSFNTDYPPRCQMSPDSGFCKGFSPQWYFNPSTGQCDMFIYGMCGGNDNRFKSPEECYTACSPDSNPCAKSSCAETGSVCKLHYLEDCFSSETACNVTAVCEAPAKDADVYMVSGVYMPDCQPSGSYSNKQCYGNYCWCVDGSGHYINGLTTQQSASLVCLPNGTSENISSTDGICPSGQPINMTCLEACTKSVCPSQPDALCVVDLCSKDCSTKFVDKQGQPVVCSGDVCSLFAFEETEECKAVDVPCPGASVKSCPDSVCSMALSQECHASSPCTVCVVDPCTCQPSFLDPITGKNLTREQCKYLTRGLCETQKCNLTQIMKSTTSPALPSCDNQGIYQPRQCQGTSCRCVDQFGATQPANSDGSCKAIDKIKRIKVTFTYNEDFNNFKNNNNLRALVDNLLDTLEMAGIDSRTIQSTSEPYQGSIKVDLTLEHNPDSYNKDLALVLDVLLQMASSGKLDLMIDGAPVRLEAITPDVKTESQVAGESGGEQVPTKETDSGLNDTEKIIIGVICGCVGLLILAVVFYCLCCRNRKQKRAMDNSFEHIAVDKKPAPLSPVFNQTYEDENDVVKIRL